MNKIIHYLLAFTLPLSSFSQNSWNGHGPDGQWSNSLNWSAGIAPMIVPAEDIVLDNSLNPDSYTVHISNSDSVVIHSLTIVPATGRTITVLIDTSSQVSIALTVTSNETGIVILNGGILNNASGSGNGAIISMNDSLRVANGGVYSHRTRRAHAALVNRLSRRPGTEKGIFEFNIPSASNTLSLSNQVYGTLRLSAAAYGKNATYSGSAASALNIRGDLELDSGVSFSLNSSDTVFIKGDLLQTGGSFNISNSTRASTIQFYGNIVQSAGVITKTGTATPSLLLSGSQPQYIKAAGGITGNIIIKIDNSAGVYLLSRLMIPYLLDLKRGKLITSPENLLILTAEGRIMADSTTNTAFVDGPLKKEGLAAADYFLFPVGKNLMHQWLALKGATGNFTAEYFRRDPHLLSNTFGSGIDHISAMEYWTLQADASPPASGSIILSYNESSSGGVTDLTTLRVVRSANGSLWNNAGNEAVTGSAGSAGSIQSSFCSDLEGAADQYTLAGSMPAQNPLPLTLISFTALREKDHLLFKWEVGDKGLADHFELQGSKDGHLFKQIAIIDAVNDLSRYEYNIPEKNTATNDIQFYRLKITEKPASVFYSKVIKTEPLLSVPSAFQCSSISVMPENRITCILQSEKKRTCRIELFDITARRVMFVYRDVSAGSNALYFDNIWLPAGMYVMRISDKENNIIKRFIK